MSSTAAPVLLTGVITGNVIINDGEWLPGRLMITQEQIRISTERSSRPDSAWEFTDDAGHWHAFAEPEDDAREADLPTLNREVVQMPCDGSCGGTCGGEGYSVDRYTCRVCGQQVEPRWIIGGPVEETIPGLKDWTLEIESYDHSLDYPSGAQLSIRMDSDAGTFFGLGFAGHRSAEYDGETFHATAEIYSAGLLGKRLT